MMKIHDKYQRVATVNGWDGQALGLRGVAREIP
jgi:hypothetical protein